MATKKEALTYSYSGKEFVFITSEKEEVEALLCTVCGEILLKPVQTSCHHSVCKKCLKVTAKKCPKCGVKRQKRTTTSDKQSQMVIKNLTVLCPNLPRRCEWKGELGSVEAHQKDHCACELVQCPNKCGTAVERRELEEHQKNHCELREYECPYCKYRGHYEKALSDHVGSCQRTPVDCPNNCEAQGLVRVDLPSHLAACPEQVIPCRYQTLGCKVRLARKEMSGHLEDRDGHLVLAMGTTSDLIHQLRTSTDSQQQQITTLQQQVSILLEKSGIQLPSAPQHPAKPWLKVDPLPLYPPFTVKMDVSTKNEDVSPPFMTHSGGYRLAVKIQQYAYKTVFFYLSLVDCPENHSLKWPVTITIKGVILNQEEDKDHIELSQVSTLDHSNDEGSDRFNITQSMWAKAAAKDQLFLRVISVDVSL